MRERLSFNREQLKKIFPDFESLKEFERLLKYVDGLIPSTTADLEIAAAGADSKAQDAIDSVARISQEIDSLSLRPTPDIDSMLNRLYQLIANLEMSINKNGDTEALIASMSRRIDEIEASIKPREDWRIEQLGDVSALTPRDLDLLQYDSTQRRWESGQNPWVDIDFPIIIRTIGANIPTLTTINGNITMPQWQVLDFNMCESQEFVHQWKEGSTVYWHLHLTTNGLDVTNRYVRFEVEYGYVDVMGVWQWPAVLDSGDLLIPANTTSQTMMIMSLGTFTPAVKIGGHSVARLRRIASVGAAPTNDPWIPMLQQHVQIDTIGSRNIGTK